MALITIPTESIRADTSSQSLNKPRSQLNFCTLRFLCKLRAGLHPRSQISAPKGQSKTWFSPERDSRDTPKGVCPVRPAKLRFERRSCPDTVPPLSPMSRSFRLRPALSEKCSMRDMSGTNHFVEKPKNGPLRRAKGRKRTKRELSRYSGEDGSDFGLLKRVKAVSSGRACSPVRVQKSSSTSKTPAFCKSARARLNALRLLSSWSAVLIL